jgi:hypothetical protein
MSANVMEVSEGIATEGRIFEPPQSNLDNEAPRYLTFVGSLIDPQTAADRPWTKGGGLEVTNPCLRYVKNFLRKGRITPLLKDTHDPRPSDWVKKASEGDGSYFPTPTPPGYVPPMLPPARGTGISTNPSPIGNMMGKLAYPGDQIRWILDHHNIMENSRLGIVELSDLKAQNYVPRTIDMGGGLRVDVDPTIWEIQRAIFPQYPFVPVLLDDIGQLLDDATEHTMIRGIVDRFQESFTAFRDYASSTIQNSHAKMREIGSKTQGYIPRYTATDLVLLEQLGMARQDREIQKATSVGSDPELREMFKAWMQTTIEEKQARIDADRRAAAALEPPAASVIDENTMMAGASGQAGASGASGASGQSGAVTAESEHEVIDEPLSNPVIDPATFERPLKGFAKINHDRKLAKEAAEKAAQQGE